MEWHCYQKSLGVALHWHYLANIFWTLKLIFSSYNLERTNCDCSCLQVYQFAYHFTQAVSVEVRKPNKSKKKTGNIVFLQNG